MFSSFQVDLPTFTRTRYYTILKFNHFDWKTIFIGQDLVQDDATHI